LGIDNFKAGFETGEALVGILESRGLVDKPVVLQYLVGRMD